MQHEVRMSDSARIEPISNSQIKRAIGVPSDGDTIVYDEASGKLVYSAPGSTSLDGAVLLDGRSGGQTVSGGTVAGESLVLRGNAADTDGDVRCLVPFVAYSVEADTLVSGDLVMRSPQGRPLARWRLVEHRHHIEFRNEVTGATFRYPGFIGRMWSRFRDWLNGYQMHKMIHLAQYESHPHDVNRVNASHATHATQSTMPHVVVDASEPPASRGPNK